MKSREEIPKYIKVEDVKVGMYARVRDGKHSKKIIRITKEYKEELKKKGVEFIKATEQLLYLIEKGDFVNEKCINQVSILENGVMYAFTSDGKNIYEEEICDVVTNSQFYNIKFVK